MILLLDANISWRLITLLQPHFTQILHVDSIDLPQPVKDTEIWNFALLKDAIIVTFDEDFYKLSILKGFPPKVVILRTGNQNKQFVANVLAKHKQDIQNLYLSPEYGLLEII